MIKLKFNVIKTDAGKCFISEGEKSYEDTYDHYEYRIDHLFFDGKKVAKTYLKNWFQLDKYPKLIQIEKFRENINGRYEIIDKGMVSKKLPEVIKEENIKKYKKSIIEELYEFKSDSEPSYLENVECEFHILCEVKNFRDAPIFSYPIENKDSWDISRYTITNLNIKHSLIDSIVFPAPLLANSPCELSSVEMYNIVRQYIRDNINPAYAIITSDYSFCFEVKKIIPLLEPKTVSYQNFFASSKKERNKLRFEKIISIEKTIFEMTNTKENHGRYTPIKAFTANNEWELKEKIDSFLKDLISVINEPLCICEHCKGSGYSNIQI